MRIIVLLRELVGAGSALEAALKIKDKNDSEVVEIVCISMAAGSETRKVLEEVYALGADKCILIEDKRLEGADTIKTAKCLCRAVEKVGGAQLILAGYQGFPGRTGNVGVMTAEFLNIPQITGVDTFQIDLDSVVAQAVYYRNTYNIKTEWPCLMIMNKGVNGLRGMTLMGVQKSLLKIVEVWNTTDLNSQCHKLENKSEVLFLSEAKKKRQHQIFKTSKELPVDIQEREAFKNYLGVLKNFYAQII